jgi:hypothetical protein
MLSKTKQAVYWIMSAPPGTKRTQIEAARKFDIAQAVVCNGLKKYVNADIRPDGRVKLRRLIK